MAQEKIRTKCLKCGTPIVAPITAAGKKGRCPRCQASIVIPQIGMVPELNPDGITASTNTRSVGDPPDSGRVFPEGTTTPATRVTPPQNISKGLSVERSASLNTSGDDHEKADTANAEERWEFVNSEGRLVFSSADENVIQESLLSGSLMPTLLCRKGSKGEYKTIRDSIAKESVKVGRLFFPIMSYVRGGAKIGAGILSCLGFIGIVIAEVSALISAGGGGCLMIIAFAPAIGMVAILSLVIGGAIGALVGWIVGLIKLPETKEAQRRMQEAA